jgi:hypothetical protein
MKADAAVLEHGPRARFPVPGGGFRALIKGIYPEFKGFLGRYPAF